MTSQTVGEGASLPMLSPGPETELGHELLRFARVMHMLKSQMAGLLPAGLDPAASQLLAWLVKSGPSRQNELADWTFLDPSTVSRRVSQLVTHGLAERRADPADGRAVQLIPTERGRELFADLQQRREEVLHQVLGDWHEADVAELRRLLSHFNDGIESLNIDHRGVQ